MKVKLEWLNELVDISDLTTDELVRLLSLYSIEVESVGKVLMGTNLVVGQVLECVKHPDSDHLSICQVDVKEEILQIVCGAPNVTTGQKVIVAKIGALLPGDFSIKKTKIRGIESCGMICSLNELGLEKKYIPEEYQSGIFYFKEEVDIGVEAIETLKMNDEVIELGITTNRGDLMSMLGVAIEVSAILNRPLKKLSYQYISSKEKTSTFLQVKNETKDCIGYYGQIFKNIRIKPSPWWLVSRLIAFGVRPINNVVDITNYILALYGQPLHAFDYEKLGNTIVVRNAYENETMITLDEVERKLLTSDIVITNGEKPVALAGVMGGIDTEITDQTKSIVIEAAVFDSNAVRKTSQRLGLRSESSARFEKGVDINRTKIALDYTCYLLQNLASAEVLPNPSFSGNENIKPIEIEITKEEINNFLGINVSREAVVDIFSRLGFEVNYPKVIIPNRRSDIKIKNDLIEEFGRIYGYDKLPVTLPASALSGLLTETQKIKRNIKTILTGLGLGEVITYSLVNEKENDYFKYNQKGESISLLMPLSQDRKFLRKTLVKSLIDNAKYCFSRKIKDLAIFEMGKVYYQEDTSPKFFLDKYPDTEYQEEEYLSILMANQFSSNIANQKIDKVDFYLIKGIVDTLFKKLNIEVKYQPLLKECVELHPKRSASIIYNNHDIGFIGSIHPKFASENDIEEVYILEIKLKEILTLKQEIKRYVPISKVPSMERDIAIVVDKKILVGEIISTIKGIDKLLSDVKVFDIYTGEKINQDQKSIAIKLTFTSYETLTDEIINNKINKILIELSNRYKATLRV